MPQRCERKNFIIFADSRVAADGDMRHQFSPLANGHITLHHAIWPNTDIGSNPGAFSNDGGGVDKISHGSLVMGHGCLIYFAHDP